MNTRTRNISIVIVVGLWFLSQLFSGVGALAQVDTGGGVAYMAHIGGFVFGMLLGRFFESPRWRELEGLD